MFFLDHHPKNSRGKNVYSVIQAKLTTRTKRTQAGQPVCQIQSPSTTGSVNRATKSWRRIFHLRNRLQAFARSSRSKSRAAPKPSHKRVRIVKAAMLISKSVFIEVSPF